MPSSTSTEPASVFSTVHSPIDILQASQLAHLINAGVAQLETQAENEAARDAVLTITSAATQLATLVRPPAQVLFDVATGYTLCAALRLVVEANVPEIIRELTLRTRTLRKAKSESGFRSDARDGDKGGVEAGAEEGNKYEGEGKGEDEQGVPVSDIARLSGVDASKLERVLRLLATHHIFVECPPSSPLVHPTSGSNSYSRPRPRPHSSGAKAEEGGVETREETKIDSSRFANNRLSCAIDSGAELEDILEPVALRAYFHFRSRGGDVGAKGQGQGQGNDNDAGVKKREREREHEHEKKDPDSDADLEESESRKRRRRWAAKYGAEAPGAGLAALVALQADESMFNATALTDVLLYPRPPSNSLTSASHAKSKSTPGPAASKQEQEQEHHQDQRAGHEAGHEHEEEEEDAFSRAHGLPHLTMYEWLSLPENAHRLHRFGCAMRGISSLMPEEAVLCGFDFSSLPPESTIIDVGGGVGSTSLPILRAYPHLRLVIQDVEEVVRNAPGFWEKHLPAAIRSKRVTFQKQDFFEEQQRQDLSHPSPSSASNDTSEHERERGRAPAVFLLRMIMHNWPDAQCLKILARLRAAAVVPESIPEGEGEGTRLVIVDSVLMRACRERSRERCADKDADVGVDAAASVMDVDVDVDVDVDGDLLEEKKGGVGGGAKNKKVEEAPEPLLANWGVANGLAYRLDLVMLANHNGVERTLAHFSALLAQAGWKITEVHAASESWMPQIVAVPAAVPADFPFPLKSRTLVRDGEDREGRERDIGIEDGSGRGSGGGKKGTAEEAGMEGEGTVETVETSRALVGSSTTPRLEEKGGMAK